METKFQTSFIPKTTIESGGGFSRPRRSPAGLFLSFAIIVFLLSGALLGACIGYKVFLEAQVKAMQSDLQKNIEKFEEDTIRSYARLDTRIDTAKELIQNHIATSYFLDFLQQETLQSVKFNDFKYEFKNDPASASVVMAGVASGYNAVAYQSVLFGEQSELIDPIFSNLDLNEKGNVVFSFSTSIKPSFVYYKRNALEPRPQTTQIKIEKSEAPNVPESEDEAPNLKTPLKQTR